MIFMIFLLLISTFYLLAYFLSYVFDNGLVSGFVFSLIQHLHISPFSCYYLFPDLHSIGGLIPLLGYLKNSHANIRAKAADVVTTIVQNNPRSQQLVMEANGFEPLIHNFSSDPDVTVRTKALGAISCMCYYTLES